MGMQGAAFATIGGQFLSALWQLAFLFGKRTIIPLNATLLKLQLNISKQIYSNRNTCIFNANIE